MQYHTIVITFCCKITTYSTVVDTYISGIQTVPSDIIKTILHEPQSMFVKEAIISLQCCSWGTVSYCLSSGFLKATKQNQWSSGVTDLSLLLFKHGDGWLRREAAPESGGNGSQTTTARW